jgi:alanyl-tRNA synthetase
LSDVLFKDTLLPIDGSLFNMQKYKLPLHGIYASYFSADTSSGLSPDNESKSILQKYLAEERIRPSMSKVGVISYQFYFEFLWTFVD